MNRILVISPHTDDAEVSSGGTISRFLREGKEVYVLVLSRAAATDPTSPAYECERALKMLGVSNIHMCDFPVRHLAESRQEILDIFVKAKQSISPDLVIIPSMKDLHQDHQVAAQEGLRAFKNHATILCFTYPWNLLAFDNTCFVEFTEEDLERKIAAVSCYGSQAKPYMTPEIIRASALTQGVCINARYAEVFEVARLVI